MRLRTSKLTINRGIDDDEDSEEDFKQDEPIGKQILIIFNHFLLMNNDCLKPVIHFLNLTTCVYFRIKLK